MARRKGKAWGNALGGYKTQSRKSNGQFGTGGGKSKAKKTVKRSKPKRTASKKTSPKKSAPKKATPKKATPKRKSNRRRNAAIVGGVALGAMALYGVENRSMNKEFKRLGGGIGTTTYDKNGIGFTTVAAKQAAYFAIDQGSMMRAMSGKNKDFLLNAPKIGRMALRPQVASVTYMHDGDKPIGFTTQITRGRRMYANDLYLEPGSRGNRRVVSSLSSNMKAIQGHQVKSGRKIVISKYRSADSERIVRNQARKLGESNVIVRKRFDPGSDFTSEITRSLDGWFNNEIRNDFKVIFANSKGAKVKK